MKPEIVIQTKNISKWYPYHNSDSYSVIKDIIDNKADSAKENKPDGFWALKDISFNIYKGESVGIIGSNGAGKSTLLKILSKITLPTSGDFLVNGKITSLLEVGTGFSPDLTGSENVYLNGSLLGMSTKEIKHKFNQIAEFAEIKRFMDTPVKHYSSGMYMRLAFSVAVHLDHEILLLDEVLAVGDAKFQEKSLKKIEEITNTEGRTVLFVSHNLMAVQNLCERCIFLDQGKVVLEGKPAGIVDYYLNKGEKADGKTSISLTEVKNRRGSGTVRFTRIHFKNNRGKKIGVFKSGQDLQIWTEYKSFDKRLESINFSLGINNSLGQQIAHLSTTIMKKTIDPKNKVIKLKINKLALNVGEYSLTVIMTDQYNKEVLDWIQRAVTFKVTFGDFYGTGSIPPGIEGSLLLDYSFV